MRIYHSVSLAKQVRGVNAARGFLRMSFIVNFQPPCYGDMETRGVTDSWKQRQVHRLPLTAME